MAALGTYFERVRSESPDCPVFLFSAGDMMQGTTMSNLVEGESIIEAFNLLGYDAAAIGNHEFDWGVEVLKERLEQADFPVLGANVYVKGTDRHPDWLLPFAVVERAGVRIGVVGAVTRSTPTTSMPARVEEFEFRSIAQALDRYIPELRRLDVDFVIAVLHAGGRCDEDGSCSGEAMAELRRTTAAFDYAITGHAHGTPLRTRLGRAPIAQGLAYTLAFGVGRLERGPDGSVAGELVEFPVTYVDQVEPDSALAELVGRYREAVAEVAERRIATLARPLVRSGGEYGLGRLIADAHRAATGTPLAMTNNGGIRHGLPAGSLTYGDLFEVQPFQNTLLRLRLRGEDLLAMLEQGVGQNGPRIHVSGMVVRYDPDARRGSRIMAVELHGGGEVYRDSLYWLTANNFVATGGGGFYALLEAVEVEETGIVDLDALIAYLKKMPQPVEAPEDRRWRRTTR